jgi:predicted Zn-dependent protease
VTSPQELCERILAIPGKVERTVIIETASTASMRWARSTLTTNGESTSTSLTVICFDGPRYASGSITSPDTAAADELVRRLDAECAHALPAADALALVAGTSTGSDRTWSEPAPLTDGAAFAHIAPQLGDWFGDGRIEHFGYAEHGWTTTWLANSSGVRLRHHEPHARFEATAKSHDRTRSAWWGASLDDFGGLDLEPGRADLARALAWQAHTVETPPGRHEVVLSSSATGDLMVDLWWSCVGQDAIEGRNVFSAADGGVRIGEQVTDRRVTLSSNPHDPVVPACPFAVVPASSPVASVFDNGTPLGAVDWIRSGVLTSLAGPRATAGQTGLPLVLSPATVRLDADGVGSLDDLVANVTEGLLVTCLWYNRLVDPQTLLLTGLTRDGVYVIRDGEVIGAAGNFRFNDSPLGLLNRIRAASGSERTQPREFGDYVHRVAMPALHVSDFNLSTTSDAL